MAKKYGWDENGIWLVIFGWLLCVGASRAGGWGIFLAFNMTLTLMTSAAWLMDCFRPARRWLPLLSRWAARCFAAFLPMAGIVYFVVSDYHRPLAETARIALCAGTIAALFCLYVNVRADIFPPRRRP